jgi:hypothetical protein
MRFNSVLAASAKSLLLSALFCAAFAWAAPVAMVTDLQGAVMLSEAGKARPAALLSYLEPGTSVSVDGGGRLVLTYLSRPVEVTVSGPAEASVGAEVVTVSRGGKPAVRALGAGRADTARNFQPVQRDRLALATVHMRGGIAPKIVLDGPVDTDLYTLTPLLSWTGPSAVASYRLLVSAAGGKTIVERTVAGTSYTVDTLKRGASYEWLVEGRLPAGDNILSARGRFQVIDAARAKRIARATPGRDANFSERVLYAAQLQSEALAYEARREWRALAAERPEDTTLREWAER